jgi:hypothetical protein
MLELEHMRWRALIFVSIFCAILSAAKKPGSFSKQDTSNTLGACEAELLGTRELH